MKSPMIAMLVLVAGCTPMAPIETPRGPCKVDEALRMRFTGTKFRSGMREDIQQRANAAIVRVLRPGDVTTREFRAERLSVLVDDGGQIDGFQCG